MRLKIVLDRRCHSDKSLASYVFGKSGHWAGDLVDLRIHNYTREFGSGVIWNYRMKHENSHGGSVQRLYVMIGLFDQHRYKLFCEAVVGGANKSLKLCM